MFNSVPIINGFIDGIQYVKNSESDKDFFRSISSLAEYMKKQQMLSTSWQRLDKLSFYELCESEDENLKNRELAKGRVIDYIKGLMQDNNELSIIEKVLNNFYMFLEALLERNPHKKAGLSKDILEKINVKNEYDVQFLLYAYLKPLFPEIRTEVCQNTGNETVRADILITDGVCVEAKCSNNNMSEKILGEQIKADIVHYRQKEIYFFIYDKCKIIKNVVSFKKAYESMTTEKEVHIIIHQPKYL